MFEECDVGGVVKINGRMSPVKCSQVGEHSQHIFEFVATSGFAAQSNVFEREAFRT